MATITGTAAGETLTGSAAEDEFAPLGGNDTLIGGGGFNGLDYRNSPGSVSVDFALGIARDGYGGTDTFSADFWRVFGSAGNDSFSAIRVSPFAHEFFGFAGDDTLMGDPGNRFTVIAHYGRSPAAIRVDLTAGRVEDGHGGIDTLTNVFRVFGSAFNDTMTGSTGDDYFRAFAGNDTIDGGAGIDQADYADSPIGLSIDLSEGTAQDGRGGVDTLISIEELRGSNFGDLLRGNAADNFFAGLNGNDTIDGGTGYDTVYYDSSTGALYTLGIVADLTAGTVRDPFGANDTLVSIEAVRGTNFGDDLRGVALADTGTRSHLRGLVGDDTLRGAGSGFTSADYADAQVTAGVVVDLAAGTASDGRGGTDTLIGINAARGSRLADRITGDGADNWLSGGDAADTLIGAGGNDRLVGDAGDDLLDGGEGSDRLQGGAGTDTALFGAGTHNVLRRGTDGWVAELPSRALDALTGVEVLSFAGGAVRLSSLASTSALEYVASFDDLIAAFGTDAAAGDAHLFANGLFEGRVATFDALRYIASNADLIAAFGTGEDAGAAHWIAYGRAEGRSTGAFDNAGYLASYADLIAAYGQDVEAATAHYISYGRAEGRAVGFDGLEYIASYGDLIAAYGTDAGAATRHYLAYGRAEGRAVGFDGLQYIASNGDLIEAFGADADAGAIHYIRFGAAEGRVRDDFDAARYLANYADLRAAFGDNEEAATEHYVRFGFREGRTDDLI